MRFYSFKAIRATADCREIARDLYGCEIVNGRCAALWRGGTNLNSVAISKKEFYDHGVKVGGGSIELAAFKFGGDIQQAQAFLGEYYHLTPTMETGPQPTKDGRYDALKRQGYQEIARYEYRDLSGAVRHVTIRLQHPDKPGKEFVQGHPDGRGGLAWTLKGVALVLYRWQEWKDSPSVLIVEGEQSADRLAAVGLPATTAAMGAGKWRDSYSDALADKDVAIFPDNDEPGREHAQLVAPALAGKAKSVRIVDAWHVGMSEKAGIDDWLKVDAARDADAVLALVEAASQWTQPKERAATSNRGLPKTPANEYGPALIGDNKPLINQSHFAARYAADSGTIHDPAVRRFFVYDDGTGLWKHQTDEATVRELGKSFQKIVSEAGCPNLLAKRSASLLHGLRELARGIAERRDVFGQRRDAIHVSNGMLVLDGNGNTELRPFGRDWYSRNRSEIAWDPKADCPRFKRELLLSAMDEDDAGLIQRYIGQCLLGVNVSQTFLVLRGTPGGGKSTLANVIEGLIGRHNVTELRVTHLTERFELIRFVGRTLLSGKDVPGDFLNMRPAHVLKALVGGDTLEGEVKNGNESFSIEGRFNVLVSTNTRLRVKLDSDAGAWRRRMLIVDYSRPKPARPIPGFDALLLREEGPGILRWAVEGAIQLMRELDTTGTMHLTEAQTRRVDDLLSESDSVRSFVRDCIESAHGAEVTIHDLTAAYRDYCEARDWDPLRDRQFQSELPDAMLEYHRAPKRNDIKADGKSVRGFRGVRL